MVMGRSYELQTVLILDLIFFTERIVNLWNALPPDIVNFDSLSSFKRSIKLVNFSGFTF